MGHAAQQCNGVAMQRGRLHAARSRAAGASLPPTWRSTNTHTAVAAEPTWIRFRMPGGSHCSSTKRSVASCCTSSRLSTSGSSCPSQKTVNWASTSMGTRCALLWPFASPSPPPGP